MKKAEFLLEVMAEIENIKSKATKKEIGQLSLGSFSVNSPTRCIYGLMTTNCRSDRAIALTPKKYLYIGNGNCFSKQSFATNPKANIEHFERFTALEKYLYMVKEPMHAKIIDYLKDRINVLELK